MLFTNSTEQQELPSPLKTSVIRTEAVGGVRMGGLKKKKKKPGRRAFGFSSSVEQGGEGLTSAVFGDSFDV